MGGLICTSRTAQNMCATKESRLQQSAIIDDESCIVLMRFVRCNLKFLFYDLVCRSNCFHTTHTTSTP